ncbi:MAG: glycine--tRNA ligase subunit beta [Thermodesulfobacteriota bacterium]
MGKDLILEVGTEEIPAGFLGDAIKSLAIITERELRNNHISFRDISTFGTPRRLTLRVTNLSDKQADKIVEALGPPRRIAFDETGVPTRAAIGFAKAQGVNVKDLVVVEHQKGEVVAIRKEIRGEKTEKVLKSLLPNIILSIPFRKSMKWGEGGTLFARPIRWIMCLYGEKTIPFKIENIKSGQRTQGHRFMKPQPFKVKDWREYIAGLKDSFVILDQEERRQIIKNEIDQIAKELGGSALGDGELLQTVTNLVEYPVVLKGSFDREFLELPKEVLISVMKNHQKYFPVFSDFAKTEELLPYFIFICGTPVKDPNVVVKGNERVIKARFRDAQFFFKEDTKTHLSEKVHKLRGMVFLSEIGTYYDKTERMEGLVEFIGLRLGLEKSAKNLRQTATLAKADLATQMVFEFPELQGTMGKYYALISGEEEEIARAIEEQYMPTSREGKLPESDLGAILSIADKVDTISACFISGLIPSGTSDPYALRRQAIAIINIILNKNFRLSLRDILNASLNGIWTQLHERKPDFPAPSENLSSSPLLAELADFMVERFRNLMVAEGFPQDVVDAVVSVESNDIIEAKRKVEALSEFRKAPDFDSLAIAFKRVVNIVRGQETTREVKKELLSERAEIRLYEDFHKVKKNVEESVLRNEYKEALFHMKSLKEAIDDYFDEVLVMDKEEEIRQNRLSTLWQIRNLFFRVADFSKISTRGIKEENSYHGQA